MANMSYCRFQNTLLDMHDCCNEMAEAETMAELDLSSDELRAFQEMFNLMEDMMREMDRLVETENAEELETE